MRSGFNLLMAIFIILILSGASVLTLKYTSISAKHFADSYIKEQAEIFSQSVLESTLLKIEAIDRATTCKDTFIFQSHDNKFQAEVTVEKYYLYGDDYYSATACSNTLKQKIQTEESNGYVLMTIVVETNSNNNKVGNYISPVRIVTRSLQRP